MHLPALSSRFVLPSQHIPMLHTMTIIQPIEDPSCFNQQKELSQLADEILPTMNCFGDGGFDNDVGS